MAVRLTTESGITLSLSGNTPIELRNGRWIIAANSTNYSVPVLDSGEFRWEKVVLVEALGRRRVQQIFAHNSTYAAGDQIGRYILTHNYGQTGKVIP
jgi:hypothetical protein